MMERNYRRNHPASLNRKGFTLVEVMMAMVIILLVLLGLVQATLLSIDGNVRNLLRDEAVRIAEQRMNGVVVDKSNNVYDGLKNIPFDDPRLAATFPNWTTAASVERKFRSLNKDYRVSWRIRDLSSSVKILEVAVGWNHKNENPIQQPTQMEFQHSITSIIGNPSS